jgi:cytochrome c oxidase cbb3-type subunit III
MNTKLNPKALIALLAFPASVFASNADFYSGLIKDPYFWLFLMVGSLLLLAYYSVKRAFDTIAKKMRPELQTEEVEESTLAVESQSAFAKWYQNFAGLKPLSKEKDMLLDHEYDGIKELDNSLPPWWLYGFYVTIFIAVGYLFHYHILGTGKLQLEEYKSEIANAEASVAAYFEKMGGMVDETNVTLVEEDARLANGRKIYQANCVACHATDGGGGVGPNLTDEYWIHGGTINEVFKIIKYGAAEKGMIAWKDLLGPADMQDVASYVLGFQGTEPANPKDPQGTKME